MAAGPDVSVRPAVRRPPRVFRLYGSFPVAAYIAVAVTAFLAMFAAWWLGAAADLASPFFLPSPGDVWHRARELVGDGTLWQDTKVSFVRIMIGWLISTAVG